MRFQARNFSNTTSLWPEGRRAAISSSVRFADSHSRNSARNRSTSAGYEKSTLLGGSFIDFASTLQLRPSRTLRRSRYLVNKPDRRYFGTSGHYRAAGPIDCSDTRLYVGTDIWSTGSRGFGGRAWQTTLVTTGCRHSACLPLRLPADRSRSPSCSRVSLRGRTARRFIS